MKKCLFEGFKYLIIFLLCNIFECFVSVSICFSRKNFGSSSNNFLNSSLSTIIQSDHARNCQHFPSFPPFEVIIIFTKASIAFQQRVCYIFHLIIYLKVSSWTSFCESDFPNSINAHLDDYSPQNDKNIKADIPTVLVRLEKELATPKNLPNKSKFLGKEKAKWLMKLIGDSFEGQKLEQSLRSYVCAFEEKINCCKSWSPYLIGFQITIADLLVLSMVASLFQKVVLLLTLHY